MNKAKQYLFIITTFVSLLLINAIFTCVTYAKTSLTSEEEVIWSQNNITFYEPCATLSDESGGICGNNQNYAGETVFSDAQMEAIEAHRPFYEKAAAEYDFPWELIAVIHVREHNLAKSNPSNGQGVYQFASEGRKASCAKTGGDFTPGNISDEQFQIQTNCVADAIKNGYGQGLDLNSDEGVKKMFFKYNGMAQAYINQAIKLGFSQAEAELGEGSPYVMNRFDAKREPSDSWGQIKRDGGNIEYPANNDFGAFTMYKALTCNGNDDASNDSDDDEPDDTDDGIASEPAKSGSNAQKIAETAFKLAWPYKQAKSQPTDSFIEATKALGTWDKNKSHGSDCGFFVKAVIATANSGIVKDPNKATMDGFRSSLLSKNSKWTQYWDVIKWDGKNSKLQSGDVIWWYENSKSQHYWIAAEQGGKMYKVDASWGGCKSCGHWGEVSSKINKSKTQKKRKKMYIFRAKGGDSTATSTEAPSCDANAPNSSNINATGAALAWPLGSSKKDYSKKSGGSPTPEFEKAISEVFSDDKKSNYMNHPYCSGFTAVVARYSGYDKKFTNSMNENEPTQAIKANRELWDVIDWDGDKSKVQGGDIINCISFDHSWMVIEDEAGKLYYAEGSRSDWAFGHIEEYKNRCGGKGKIIRAKNANNSNVGVSVTGGVKTSSTTGTITSSGKGNKNIGASAIELAWPESELNGKNYTKKPTEKFKNFYVTLPGAVKSGVEAYGKSCDYFASTVIKYSGVEGNDFPSTLHDMQPYVEKSADWEEVNMSNPKKPDEYQSGDLVFFYNAKGWKDRPYKGQYLAHVGIFAKDSSGKGHIVQASHADSTDPGYYGIVKDTSNITSNYFPVIRVYRNKNSKTGAAEEAEECDLCAGQEESSDSDGSGGGALKEGGFSSASEAESVIIGAYKKYKGDPPSDFGTLRCHSSRDNCSTFSLWFLKTYVGWNAKLGGNGKQIADRVYNAHHKDHPEMTKSNNPSVYSIASWSSPVGKIWSSNHTGVVVGINESKNEILIADAAWCGSEGQIRVDKLSKYKGHGTYVSLAPYVKGLEK